MPVNSNELNPVKEYAGYAICDKEENSRELKVFCPDLLPFHTGKLLPTDATVRVVNSSNTSSTYSNDVCESNYITCTYRDDSSNHTAFPPDVRAGERVLRVIEEPKHIVLLFQVRLIMILYLTTITLTILRWILEEATVSH